MTAITRVDSILLLLDEGRRARNYNNSRVVLHRSSARREHSGRNIKKKKKCNTNTWPTPTVVRLYKAVPRRRVFTVRISSPSSLPQTATMDSRISALFVCAVVFAAFAAGAPQKEKETAAAATGPGYTTKYDNLDIDQVLASKRLVNNYVQCLLDKKPCTAEAAELRSTYIETAASRGPN